VGRRLLLLIAAIIVAAFGTTLVFVYVNGVNDRAMADQNPVKILVAKKLIPAGTKASDAQAQGALEQKDVPKAAVANGALSDITPVADELSLTEIYPGQQVLSQLFGSKPEEHASLQLPKGDLAVSIQLSDPTRVAGFATPGSHVAIFADLGDIQETPATPRNATYTRLLLPDILVLASGPTTASTTTTKDNQTGQVTNQQVPQTILTMAVTQEQAQKLIHTSLHAKLYFTLRNSVSAVDPSMAATDLGNLFK
jgi:pilus assembly protein CpaB